MRRAREHRWALLSLAFAGAALSSSAAVAGSSSITMTGAPQGFSDLEEPRELVVDVYFGNRKIGETRISARPGFVQFHDPAALLNLVPNLKVSPDIASRFASELPDHAALACSQTNTQACGALDTQLADVILDADNFRVDLFIGSQFLDVADASGTYLPAPSAPLSLTSSIGGAIAGSTSASTSYNFQNRTIVGFRNARIRSDTSFASDLGFIVDDLVAEVDTDRHRYSGGLFWAPGVDFTGRRRIAGLGFSTQFDTREDSDKLDSTPLILFLNQPSRVEVLIDGRLVTSASYEAGNRFIETSSLPSGSYQLVLRIREPGGAVREERRFFVKNAEIAPVGQPVYYAYAGLLANTKRNEPISLGKTLYYQIGAARRLSTAFAIDGAVLGTQEKVMAELGTWLVTDVARLRLAGLASSKGDKAVMLQAGSGGLGGLNFNIDVQRVWSKSGEPLIPLPTYSENFGSTPAVGVQVARGSYTQASGSLTWSLGGAFLSLTGSYRKDDHFKADYGIGPSINWPVINRGGFQLILNADAQRGRSTSAAFAGFRVLYTRGGYSTLSTTGYGMLNSREEGRRRSRPVGSMSAQYYHADEDRTQVALEAALQRDVETTNARAQAQAYTRLGSARAEILHGLEGDGGTQYGLSFQTGVAFGGRALELGGRDLNQSAIIASLDGSAGDADFDVLIDDVSQGRLRAGSRLPIFLEAYRSYNLRLRPIGGAPVAYDTAARTVTLFPGNVEQVRWEAEALVTFFGQAVTPDGTPIRNAPITATRGIGQTDDNGYFEVDASARDVLKLDRGDGSTCKLALAGPSQDSDYVRLGKVTCR